MKQLFAAYIHRMVERPTETIYFNVDLFQVSY